MSVPLLISISWHEIMMNGLDRALFLLGYGKKKQYNLCWTAPFTSYPSGSVAGNQDPYPLD